MDKHDTITEAMKSVLNAQKMMLKLKKMNNNDKENARIYNISDELKFAFNSLERLWQIAE